MDRTHPENMFIEGRRIWTVSIAMGEHTTE